MEEEIINIKKRIEKYKNDLDSDYILIETTLSILKYLLSENISHEQINSLYNGIKNTLEMLEEKIKQIELK